MPTTKISGSFSQKQETIRKIGSEPSKFSQLRWLWLGFSLTGVAMLSATAGALLAVSLSTTPLMQSRLSPEEAAVFSQGNISTTNLKLPELTRPVNILVMGIKVLPSDLGEKPDPSLGGYEPVLNSFEGLSDTMLLLRFNPQTKKLIVLSIPRDTRTFVEGAGVTKINAANVYGGPALSAKTVSSLLGDVRIDRYVRINVQGVEKLIDALGGVTIHIPYDMKYTDNTQHLYIDFKAGKQHLDGAQTQNLLRFRHDKLGDIGRVQRQQMVMRALMEQALNPVTLARLPEILRVIQSHIDTNLSVEELVALVGFGVKMNRSDAQMLLVPGQFSNEGEYEASYWLPNRRGISQLVSQYLNSSDESEPKERRKTDLTNVKIAIKDSTGDSESVNALVRKLRRAGYRNVQVTEPWSETLSETRILAQKGDSEAAEAVSQALGTGEVRVESTGSLNSDITIFVGKDWIQQQKSSQ
ncbi:LCP family protein [[Phormidium] sp. LEGE 05292]|uniref:LCP family protein n=1 Tax=[Phormidium] sp. LEGE 05292 TaxID=767427 RepID=UPI002AD33CD8|nr:LCP family protein [Phormidium sp. LEGE 05292]